MDDEGRQSKSQLSRFSGGILGRAKQTVINGGTFTNVISAGKDHQVGFDTLQKHVSSAAFHNASDRVDPPRCHENTRRVVLQEILSWMILADTERAAWMAWLNGAAGAGKSAICQTIAEMCATQGIHVASFFFFRTDPTRNTIQPLVATLVYQMIQLVPEIKDIILSTIEGNPLIFQQSLATQLDELVIKPLRWLQFSGSVLKLRFIIDGVDECSGSEHQLDIIHTFSKFLAVKDCPIILLLGSRAERHLQPAFRSSRVSQILLQLPLDDNYLSDNDIYIFIRDKFAEIKATHSFSHLINVTWPPPSIVQEIVDKSSGQFIYASVVMKFISDPRSHPESQLAIIHGLRPSGFGPPLPFAQLDTFYRHIFSQVQNIELLATLLAYIIIGRSAAIDDLVRFFSMSEADVHIAFADLPSVIACQDGEIRFLHASLPDFLLDEARSGGYYINPTIWSTRLCIYWLQNASSGHFKKRNYVSILNLLEHAEGTPSLRKNILTFNPYQHDSQAFVRFFTDYLSAIQKIDFNDSGEAFRRQLYIITRCVKNRQLDLPILRKTHDISKVLHQIDLEDAEDNQARALIQLQRSSSADSDVDGTALRARKDGEKVKAHRRSQSLTSWFKKFG